MQYNFYPNKELLQQYRNVFSHKEAKNVLFHMLYDLGFFNENTQPEDLPLKNYATRLLTILGGGEVKMNAVEMLVNGLKVNPIPEDIKKDDF